MSTITRNKHWGIAQLIERRILAPKVPGLSPGIPTNNTEGYPSW